MNRPDDGPEISVLIPAHNEAENILPTLRELDNALAAIEPPLKNYEMVVIDDHSTDGTFATIEGMSPKVRAVRLSRRSGSHVAIRAGLQLAKGNAVIAMSADGQDNPAALSEMLQLWKGGADIVWALRRDRKNENWAVRINSAIFYRLLNWFYADTDNTINLNRADFYLLDRKVVDGLNRCEERKTSLPGLIIWSGFRQSFVEYDRSERRFGNSRWNWGRRFALALDWIISFSNIPLRSLIFIGAIMAFLGVLYAGFLILNAIFGSPAAGWTSVMVAILILSGIQMCMLGVIGEYLWHNLEETRRRPLFFIERDTQKKITFDRKESL